MPVPIKVIISLLALALCTAVYWFDMRSGIPDLASAKWVALALGPLMVGAIWVFPEASKKEVSSIRKDNAAR